MPASDTECKVSETIPPGNGCDATLDWWFSEEAKAIAEKTKSGASQIPDAFIAS
jgi:penicillin-insensitive murein endopeptidase